MYLKDIEKSIKEITALLVSADDVAQDALNLDGSFLELGINSVLAVEVVEAMNQKLGIELGVEVMFDYRDIKELAHFILLHYGEDLSMRFAALTDDIRSSEEALIATNGKKQGPVMQEGDEADEGDRIGARLDPYGARPS